MEMIFVKYFGSCVLKYGQVKGNSFILYYLSHVLFFSSTNLVMYGETINWNKHGFTFSDLTNGAQTNISDLIWSIFTWQQAFSWLLARSDVFTKLTSSTPVIYSKCMFTAATTLTM